MRLAKRLAHAILYLECAECGHVIWPWQERCGFRHTTCMHASIIRNWRRNLEATTGPIGPWACTWCHRIPSTEARP